MRNLGLAISTAKFTVSLVLAHFLVWPVSAGIILDDFNITRPYPPCCGEYGANFSFESNVVQNGSGTLVIGGTARDNGGFYHDQKGKVLWDFTGQSNLIVRAKVLAGNEAENFIVVFRDANQKRMLFKFPFSILNSNNFTALSKPLFTPDWTDADASQPFDYARIISMDLMGEFTQVDLPFRLELDSIEVQEHSVPSAVALSGGQLQQKTNSPELKGTNSVVSAISTLAQSSIAVTNLPEHIQPLLIYYGFEPTWVNARKLTPADKGILVQLYRQEPSIAKKRALTIALGFVGDEEVVEMFKHTLSDQYARRKLTTGTAETDEELVMSTTVSALGFLANKSDSAYELLKQGANWKFWRDYCKFTPASGVDFYGLLSTRSIQAIGHSGRPDVTNALEILKTQRPNDGAFVDAEFANDMIIGGGLEYYKHLYFNLDQSLERMRQWKQERQQSRQQGEGASPIPGKK
jgi:hypothetical protein